MVDGFKTWRQFKKFEAFFRGEGPQASLVDFDQV
jgi:hypothetical protein